VFYNIFLLILRICQRFALMPNGCYIAPCVLYLVILSYCNASANSLNKVDYQKPGACLET